MRNLLGDASDEDEMAEDSDDEIDDDDDDVLAR